MCLSEVKFAGWLDLRLQPGFKLATAPLVTYPKSPDMSTSTSRMWVLQPEAVTVGLPEGSLPRTRLTEMVMPLIYMSKEPCSLLEEMREAWWIPQLD